MNTKPQKQIWMPGSKQNGLNIYALWFAILLAGITIGLFINPKDPVITSRNTAPQTSLAGLDVARQFTCSCGSCGEKDLNDCSCPTANSTKQFIEMNLNKGASADEVLNLVKITYGHYKG